MKGKPSITINGRLYDAVTGMPIAQNTQPPNAKPTPGQKLPKGGIHRAFGDIAVPASAKQTPFKQVVAAPAKKIATQSISQTVHRKPQKSQTLYRAAVKRPMVQAKAQSPAISKFAPNTTPIQTVQLSKTVTQQPEAAPTVHPAVAKALQHRQQQTAPAKPQQPQSSKELKEALIKERLAEAQQKKLVGKKGQDDSQRRRPRLTAILTSSLAVLLLGGYLTYINMPNISMKVAATRSGVAASFPGYNPDGFSFHGPITYSPGEVSINFKSNTNNTSFTIKQKKTNWDSQAVLDNYVTKQTQNYMTQQEQGLTIYSFGNHAAWVNGGLLYTVEGNAQLSSEQVLRLATSM